MFDTEEKPWGMVLLLIALAMVSFYFSGCNAKIPPIDVTIWAGDSAHAGVTRAQEHQTILATDPKFDALACMTYTDIKKIYATLLTCKDWGDQPTMSVSEVKNLLDKNSELVTHVASQDSK